MLDEGQKQASQLTYAQLPASVAAKARQAISQIRTSGASTAGR
jgi:hypothetical protein